MAGDDGGGEFAAELRRRRADVARSLAAVAADPHVNRSYISNLEHGHRRASREVAAALDGALQAGGALLAAWHDDEAQRKAGRDPDVWDRLARVVERPERVDRAVVDHLAVALDGQRRLEDVVGARQVLPATLAQLGMIDGLARAARDDVRREVLSMGAQWRQFAAWESQDVGRPADALAHHDRALEAAQEIDDNMVVTVLSLKSHLAWSQRDPARAFGLAAAGQRRSGHATPGVLALIAQQEARGHGLDGDADAAHRLLDRSEQWAARAADRPDDEPPWIYFSDPRRVLFQRGIVDLELGDHHRAVDRFAAALVALPASYRRDRARYTANLALAAARAGDVEHATTAGREALTLARETGSSHALTDLRATRAALDRHAGHPAVQAFDGYVDVHIPGGVAHP